MPSDNGNEYDEVIFLEGERYAPEELKIIFGKEGDSTREEYPLEDLESIRLRNPEELKENEGVRALLGGLEIYSEGGNTHQTDRPMLVIDDGGLGNRPLIGKEELSDFADYLEPIEG